MPKSRSQLLHWQAWRESKDQKSGHSFESGEAIYPRCTNHPQPDLPTFCTLLWILWNGFVSADRL